MTSKIFIVIFLISQVVNIESARILAVYPTPSVSHQVVFRRLTDALIRRGHEVTVITTDPAYPVGQAPANLTEIDVHDISYELWRNEFGKESVGNKVDIYKQVGVIFRIMSKIIKKQMETKEVDEILKKRTGKYDLLFLEAYVKPILIFSHLLKIPVIQISSFGGIKYNYNVFGAPTHPLLYPAHVHQRLYNLSNWEKLHQLYNHMWFEIEMYRIEEEYNKELRTVFGPDVPSIKELSNNVDMLFLNIHSIWADNQPVPPSVVYIGGIHMTAPKKLPNDLKNFLDSSKNGVIYFSLGTNVNPSSLPADKIQMFVRVLSRLPYDILWKWDQDELPGKSNNIKTFKWFPQFDVLKHPNVKVFITQGGLQSTDEAINAGVPLIGIPMLVDQWYNVEKYVQHKIGVQLDMAYLTEDEFMKAIQNVIEDYSFRENIIKLRTIIEDQPQSALERAVWWTEHVLRHSGGKHLRAAGANISWAEYLQLELISILIISLIILFVILYISYKYISSHWKSNIKIKVL